jgi:hypothetical protein
VPRRRCRWLTPQFPFWGRSAGSMGGEGVVYKGWVCTFCFCDCWCWDCCCEMMEGERVWEASSLRGGCLVGGRCFVYIGPSDSLGHGGQRSSPQFNPGVEYSARRRLPSKTTTNSHDHQIHQLGRWEQSPKRHAHPSNHAHTHPSSHAISHHKPQHRRHKQKNHGNKRRCFFNSS